MRPTLTDRELRGPACERFARSLGIRHPRGAIVTRVPSARKREERNVCAGVLVMAAVRGSDRPGRT